MTDENGEPPSEEVIFWILATLSLGAMVGLNMGYSRFKHGVMVWIKMLWWGQTRVHLDCWAFLFGKSECEE